MTNHSELPNAPSSAPLRRGAVAVVRREQHLLVIRRSLTVEAPGAYCFPGGGIEPGECEHETISREMMEELGVVARPVRRLWRSRTAWRVELAWWQAEIDHNAEIRPCPEEVASFQWFTLEELRVLPGLLESNHQFLAALSDGKFSLSEE